MNRSRRRCERKGEAVEHIAAVLVKRRSSEAWVEIQPAVLIQDNVAALREIIV